MDLLGLKLQLLIGPGVPMPASLEMMEALQEVEVSHSDDDEKRSGFKLVFKEGRSGPRDLVDYPLVKDSRLGALSRVIICVLFGADLQVVMDGVIIDQQLQPGEATSASTLTLLGEDVSVMMDFEEKHVEHPALPKFGTAALLLAGYSKYGLIPNSLPSPNDSIPLPTDYIPVQAGATDLQYIRDLAKSLDYVFYIEPGPVPYINQAYFGPRKIVGLPQKALTANMGPASNVRQISFGYNAEQATAVSGKHQDRDTGAQSTIQNTPALKIPQSSQPAVTSQSVIRRKRLQAASGMSMADALARANAQASPSQDAVTADGELDSLRYGRLLKARQLVGVRGVGSSFDGLYYVKSVTHSIKRGAYTQKFSLRRDGKGTTTLILPNL
jgi:hypothetical protein